MIFSLRARLIACFVLFVALSPIFRAAGQAGAPPGLPAPILTYQARNYFPADFEGKAPATPGSEVVVSALFVSANKLMRLSDAVFTWYVDERLKQRGGSSEFSFVVSAVPPGEHFVRLIAASGSQVVEATLAIPITAPRVVIDSSYPLGRLKAGSEASFRILPYFFAGTSIGDLLFFWEVNGRERRAAGSDNQLVVRLGTPGFESDRAFTLAATVQNGRNTLQIAKQKQTFTIFP